MDPNSTRPTPGIQEAEEEPAEDVPQPVSPSETHMPSIIDQALAMQRRFEPGHIETFNDKLLSVTEEISKDCLSQLRESYITYSEDRRLAAHLGTAFATETETTTEVKIIEMDHFKQVLSFTVHFEVAQKCFSPNNKYLYLFGPRLIEIREIVNGNSVCQIPYSDITGFDRTPFKEELTNSDRRVVKSKDLQRLIATKAGQTCLPSYEKKKTHLVLLTTAAILVVDMSFKRIDVPDPKRDFLWLCLSNYNDLIGGNQQSKGILICDEFKCIGSSKENCTCSH